MATEGSDFSGFTCSEAEVASILFVPPILWRYLKLEGQIRPPTMLN